MTKSHVSQAAVEAEQEYRPIPFTAFVPLLPLCLAEARQLPLALQPHLNECERGLGHTQGDAGSDGRTPFMTPLETNTWANQGEWRDTLGPYDPESYVRGLASRQD